MEPPLLGRRPGELTGVWAGPSHLVCERWARRPEGWGSTWERLRLQELAGSSWRNGAGERHQNIPSLCAEEEGPGGAVQIHQVSWMQAAEMAPGYLCQKRNVLEGLMGVWRAGLGMGWI